MTCRSDLPSGWDALNAFISILSLELKTSIAVQFPSFPFTSVRRFASHSSAEPFISGASWFRVATVQLLPLHFHSPQSHSPHSTTVRSTSMHRPSSQRLLAAGCYRTTIAIHSRALHFTARHFKRIAKQFNSQASWFRLLPYNYFHCIAHHCSSMQVHSHHVSAAHNSVLLHAPFKATKADVASVTKPFDKPGVSHQVLQPIKVQDVVTEQAIHTH
jgi:hypothetical protein